MACLYEVLPDRGLGRLWVIGDQALVVGRGQFAEAQLQDEALSRSHFLIVREGRDYFVVDLGSENGTSLNGRKVSGHRLRPKDMIEAGQSRFLFCSEPMSAAQTGMGLPPEVATRSALIEPRLELRS